MAQWLQQGVQSRGPVCDIGLISILVRSYKLENSEVKSQSHRVWNVVVIKLWWYRHMKNKIVWSRFYEKMDLRLFYFRVTI